MGVIIDRITQTCPCNILQYFTAVKNGNFHMKTIQKNNFVNNTKFLLPFGILYLNAEVGGLSMRLKIKKKRIKIKTTKAK